VQSTIGNLHISCMSKLLWWEERRGLAVTLIKPVTLGLVEQPGECFLCGL